MALTHRSGTTWCSFSDPGDRTYRTPGQYMIGEWFIQAEVLPGLSMATLLALEARFEDDLQAALQSLVAEGMTFVIVT